MSVIVMGDRLLFEAEVSDPTEVDEVIAELKEALHEHVRSRFITNHPNGTISTNIHPDHLAPTP
jgi:hypothetical protein